jgi:hypothetical protein
MIKQGFTFLSRRPPYTTPHLYIIISSIIDEIVVFVNITTPKWDSDNTCIINVGDHSFVKHQSIINYGDAKETRVEYLREAVSNKFITPHDPVSPDLLQRIQAGALNSPAFNPSLLKYIPKP